MKREMLVKVAATVLAQFDDPLALQKAEAIAAQLDIFAAVMGDATPPPSQLSPQFASDPAALGRAPRVAFPPANPAAMQATQPIETGPADQSAGPDYDRREYAPDDPGNLIIAATSIPDKAARVAAPPAAPVRSLRNQPQIAGRMKVTDFNQLIQERTPLFLTIEVPGDDGELHRAKLQRNVISMHAEEAVRLIYYPSGASPSMQEITQVQAVLSVDDIPINIPVILDKLKRDAVECLRPKDVQSVTPRVNVGAVLSRSKYDDGSSAMPDSTAAQENQNAFGTIGL